MFIRIIACFDHFSQSESKTKIFIKIIVKIKYGIFTILETSLNIKLCTSHYNCQILSNFLLHIAFTCWYVVFFENLIHLDIRFCDIKT